MFRCQSCDKEYNTHQALNAHGISHKSGARYSSIRQHKSKSEKPNITYKCLNCDIECQFGHAKKNLYCSFNCQHEHSRNQRITNWLSTGIFGTRRDNDKVPGWAKKHLLEQRGHECQICKNDIWNNLPITLEVNHIDGNATNNFITNLELICPNCHSQTDSWKAKNKGNGRKNRYKSSNLTQ